ncbi:MAG: hypothetical protein GWP56_13355 [Gammaproteobacteria bacterium]|nr:hypothetical protein [Gammaproteobacteria bacterium]
MPGRHWCLFAGGCAWFKCERYRSIALGDHTLILGEVREFAQNLAAPLVFSGGCFRELHMETIDSSRQAYRAA